ncbi:DNA-directed RNA polymerase subunit K [Candidatus Woesearchaeota archaeon]|nr:DNA-directed RNA polymerase subunit K [Candidatus Woesearchaeota archaeon]
MSKTTESIEYTKFEKARIIGSRALQIAMGAPILIKMTDEDFERVRFNPVEIAKMELQHNAIPLTVKRLLPHEQ